MNETTPARHFEEAAVSPRATPAVRIDPAKLAANIARMAGIAKAAAAELHPHVKTHKSVEIARMQVAAGAAGVTASKPSEALVFVRAGLPSVTVAYPLMRKEAAAALMTAAKGTGSRLRFIAAHAVHLEVLEAAARETGSIAEVFLKVDTGLARIGVTAGSGAAAVLAHILAASPSLRYLGLLSHAGHAYGAPEPARRAEIAAQELAQLRAVQAEVAPVLGLPGRISVGSTPTCLGAPVQRGSDELRPGNYAFLDMTAVRLGLCSPEEIALSVEATVIFAAPGRAVIDAGSKELSSDKGAHGTGGDVGHGRIEVVRGGQSHVLTVARLSEEHGVIADPDGLLAVGEQVRVLPNHACAVAALAPRLWLGDREIAVDARGCTD
ncbi:alanine racemase [Mangrovicoccus sp. HB161399]|uniref:alanine racemase n=1 Tax=Mangrovicoccus sp. HB161399 TaxID=2720392 RepID=UPI0015559654|nr:alanine racemase [Mangrovicoccus sp. HB161399]